MSQLHVLRPRLVLLCLLIIVIVNLISWYSPLPTFIQLMFNSVAVVMSGVIVRVPLKKKSTSETLDKNEAFRFIGLASCVLFTLFILVKILPKQLFKYIITIYFMVFASFMISNACSDFLQFVTGVQNKPIFSYKLGGFLKVLFQTSNFQMSKASLLVGIPIALLLIIGFILTQHFLLNNIIGIIITIYAHQQSYMSLGSTKAGLVLLWGLFCYDVFWVYGTEVMQTVAKNMKMPLLLKFPLTNPTDQKRFSMLGLGDLIVPGLFIILCLKFDIQKALNKKIKKLSDFELSYYYSTIIGYTIGMATTGVVMLVFEKPQPALLFLVPGVTGAAFINCYIRNEMKQFFNFQQNIPIQKNQQQEKVIPDENQDKKIQKND